MEENQQRSEHSQKLKEQAFILGGIIVAFWLLEMVDMLLGGSFDNLGIVPRQINGLRGIVFAPMLHSGFGHLAANTIPFIILGWFVLLRGLRTFAYVILIVMGVSGLGTWLIAPSNSIHIGASGVVFGFFGYLLLRGYFERSWESVLLAILVFVLYGGMIFGVLPRGAGISWQMHLFGFIGGGVAAYFLTTRRNLVRNIEDEIHIISDNG